MKILDHILYNYSIPRVGLYCTGHWELRGTEGTGEMRAAWQWAGCKWGSRDLARGILMGPPSHPNPRQLRDSTRWELPGYHSIIVSMCHTSCFCPIWLFFSELWPAGLSCVELVFPDCSLISDHYREVIGKNKNTLTSHIPSNLTLLFSCSLPTILLSSQIQTYWKNHCFPGS